MIVCAGAIWLNPFATVLFTVCSAITVECCVLFPCCVGVFGMFAVMYSTCSRGMRFQEGLCVLDACMMFNLSGPCELLFLLCFIASWT